MKTTLEAMGASSADNDSYLFTFVVAVGIMQACLSMVLFVLGSYVSNRVAGNIFAMKRYIKDSMDGKVGRFKLRKHDEFKELEGVLTELNERLAPKEGGESDKEKIKKAG